MTKTIGGRCKGILVSIHTARTGKYLYYQMADHSSGKRKLWSFSNLEKAKAKAQEIAGATSSGDRFLIPQKSVPTS